jgi:hypothetical protein
VREYDGTLLEFIRSSGVPLADTVAMVCTSVMTPLSATLVALVELISQALRRVDPSGVGVLVAVPGTDVFVAVLLIGVDVRVAVALVAVVAVAVLVAPKSLTSLLFASGR